MKPATDKRNGTDANETGHNSLRRFDIRQRTISNPKSGRGLIIALLTLTLCSRLSLAGPPGAVGDLYVCDATGNTIQQFDGVTGAWAGEFVPTNSGGLCDPLGVVFRPFGNLLVANSNCARSILEYNGQTGAFIGQFVPVGNGGLGSPYGLTFGPNGNLFVISVGGTSEVLEYDGQTGAFVGVFVTNGSGGLDFPFALTFGPNGNLFVVCFAGACSSILEYDGSTGDFIRVFASGGLSAPQDLVFGPDHHLYVSSRNTHQVLKFDGQTGASLGVFASDNVQSPAGLCFRPNGNLLVVNNVGTARIDEYDGVTGALVGTFATMPSSGVAQKIAFKPFAGPWPAPNITGFSTGQATQCGLVYDTVITGTGLVGRASVKLTRAGEPDIIGWIASTTADTEITAHFNFTGAALGFWDLVLTYPDGQTSSLVNAVDVQCPSPTVTSIDPVSTNNCGLLVDAVIAGGDFVEGASVTLALAGESDVIGTVTSETPPTSITATFDLTDVTPGNWDVVVTNPGDTGTGMLVGGLAIAACPPPVVGAVDPSNVDNCAILPGLRIEGADFLPGATVTLSKAGESDIAATVTGLLPDLITVHVDLTGAAAGTWDMTVTNSGAYSGSGTLVAGLSVSPCPAPSLTSVSPSQVDNCSNLWLTVRGGGFVEGTTVKLSRAGEPDIDASSVDVRFSNLLFALMDLSGAATGNWNLEITRPDLQTTTLSAALMVQSECLPSELGAAGDLYTTVNGRVRQHDGGTFDLVGVFVDTGSSLEPMGITFGPNGNLFASGLGSFRHEVHEFDGQSGIFVRVFSVLSTDRLLRDLIFGPNGNLFVADSANHEIIEIDGLTGAFVGVFASGNGLSDPHDLAFGGSNDNLFVTSQSYNIGGSPDTPGSVFEYDGSTGAFVGVFAADVAGPAPGICDPPFTALKSLVFGPNGNLFAGLANNACSKGAKIVELDGVTGAVVQEFGQDDEMERNTDLIFGANGHLLVSATRDILFEYDISTGSLQRQAFIFPAALAFKPPCPSITPAIVDFSPNQADFCGELQGATVTGIGLARGCAEVKLVRAGEADIIGDIVGGTPLVSIEANFDITGAAVGFWDVVITYPDLQTDTLVDALEVTDPIICGPPMITDLSPTTQMNCGNLSARLGFDVYPTITGTNFTPSTTVKLVRAGQPDVEGTVIEVLPPTIITADFDLTDVELGMWDLVVTNPDLQSATLPNALEVTQCLFGVPGDLYVMLSGQVLEYDGASGELIGQFSIEAHTQYGITWLPNGNLAAGNVQPGAEGSIEEFDGRSGQFLGNFVDVSAGGLQRPEAMTIGPNGNLFVVDVLGHQVLEYDGTTGAFVRIFAHGGSEGTLRTPRDLAFGGQNDNLFVSNLFPIFFSPNGSRHFISEFDSTTGAFINTWGTGSKFYESAFIYLAFGPNGNLFATPSSQPLAIELDIDLGQFLGESLPANKLVGSALSPTFGGPNNDLFIVDEISGGSGSVIERFDGTLTNFHRGTFATVSGSHIIWNMVFKPMVGPFPVPQLTTAAFTGGDRCAANDVARVTLTGSGLLPNFAQVRLTKAGEDDIIGRVVGGSRPWVSPSQVIVDFERLSVAAPGDWNVVVSYPDDGPSDTLIAGLTVAMCSAPGVTAIAPAQATNCARFVAGPQTIAATVTGAGFGGNPLVRPVVTLSRAGQPDITGTNVELVDSAEIMCEFDLWQVQPGAWDITVTNPDGQSATLVGGLTVIDCAPAPTSIQPAAADNCGHLIDATVLGSGFIRGVQLFLTMPGEPDIRGVNIRYIDGTELVADFDLTDAAPGSWSLVVTNPDGQSATALDVLAVTTGGCASRLRRPRVSEVYVAGNPLPDLPPGGRPTMAMIDDSGTVFFSVNVLGPTNKMRFYRVETGGVFDLVYYTDQIIDGAQTAPVTPGWAVSRDGHLFIRDYYNLYHAAPGQPVRRIVARQDPIPALPDVRFNMLDADPSEWPMTVGVGGQCLFSQWFAGFGTNSSNDWGLVAFWDDAFAVPIREGDPVPEIGAGATVDYGSQEALLGGWLDIRICNDVFGTLVDGMGWPLGFSRPIGVNAAGWCTARTLPDGPQGLDQEVIWCGPTQDLQPVVWAGRAAHGVPGAVYQRFDNTIAFGSRMFTNVLINDYGEFTYGAQLSDGRRGLWIGPRDDPQPILLNGDPAPGLPGLSFTLMNESDEPIERDRHNRPGTMALNNRGDLAFRVSLAGTGVTESNDESIWLRTSDGTLMMLVREGDPAFNCGGGAGFTPGRPLLNDRGDIAIDGEYANGDTAAFLFDHRSRNWVRLLGTGDVVNGVFVDKVTLNEAGGDHPLGMDIPYGLGVASGLSKDGAVLLQVNCPADLFTTLGFGAIYRVDLISIGDINDDGSVDGRDIQPFIDLMLGLDTDPDRFWAADLVVDDVVDFDDLTVFVDLLLDRPIMFGDAPIVNQVFFNTPTDNCPPTEQFVTVLGTNFQTGSWLGCGTAKLVQPGKPDVSPSQFEVLDPTTITATFPMDGVPTGTWRLVVVNPDGQESEESSATLEVTACSTGACCLSNGNCSIESFADCITIGGIYAGDDVSCAAAGCSGCFSCPGGAIHENEACSIGIDNVNAGCSGTGPENFIPISCGQTVCGESWADGGARDFDWYELNVNEATRISWNVTGDYSFRAWIIDGNSSDCEVVVNNAIVTNASGPCGGFALTADVTTGRYYLVVGADVFEGHPCSLGPWSYTATVSCQTLTPPGNDDCANAQPIFDGGAPLLTVGASTDGPDLPVSCHSGNATNMASDVWYCYTATCTGTVTLSTCLGSADFDTWLAVYDGCGCPPDNNDLLACNDDNCPSGTATLSELSFPVVSGQTYLIRAGGFPSVAGFWGTGFMTLDCQP